MDQLKEMLSLTKEMIGKMSKIRRYRVMYNEVNLD